VFPKELLNPELDDEKKELVYPELPHPDKKVKVIRTKNSFFIF